MVKLPRLPTGKLTWQQNITCFNGEIVIPLWLIVQPAVFGSFQICVSKLALQNLANLFHSNFKKEVSGMVGFNGS